MGFVFVFYLSYYDILVVHVNSCLLDHNERMEKKFNWIQFNPEGVSRVFCGLCEASKRDAIVVQRLLDDRHRRLMHSINFCLFVLIIPWFPHLSIWPEMQIGGLLSSPVEYSRQALRCDISIVSGHNARNTMQSGRYDRLAVAVLIKLNYTFYSYL